MAIKLTKGQTINLNKDEHDLSSITLGLGWKVQPQKVGWFSSVFGGKKGEDLDLDAIAFLLDDQDKVTTIGNERLIGGDVVFFNSLKHPTGHVYHTGDNRQGGDGAQDDEQIVVKLDALSSRYAKILFFVCIYQGIQRQQHFGMIESAYIRAIDAKGKEIARYPLDAESAYAGKCTMVFGEVYRRDAGWKFRAIGEAYPEDTLVALLKKHYPR